MEYYNLKIMARRSRFDKAEHDKIIEPESFEYEQYEDKFKKFPTKKRYQAAKSVPKIEKPEKPEKFDRHEKSEKSEKPKRPERGKIKEEAEVPEERFDKAFGLSLGLIALLSLLVFIPVLGWLLCLTLVPYLACNLGCRYVSKRNGIQVGILIGIVWSIIELYILFQILTIIKISLANPGIYSGLDMAIIILIFIANILFCMFGGYTGGAKSEMFYKESTRKINLKDRKVQSEF